MTYQYAPDASDRDVEIAEELNATLFNKLDVPLDDFIVYADGGGEFRIELGDGKGSMD